MTKSEKGDDIPANDEIDKKTRETKGRFFCLDKSEKGDDIPTNDERDE